MSVAAQEVEIEKRVSESEVRGIRAVVFKLDAGSAQNATASKAVDPFDGIKGDILSPPVDLLTLAKMSSLSTELGPATEAMETNIEGFGYWLQPRVDLHREDVAEEEKKAVRDEERRLKNFFSTACRGRSRRISFTALRCRTRHDYELTGNAFWEALRSKTKRLVAFNHIPSHQVRIVNAEPEQVKVEVKYLEVQGDGSVAIGTYTDYVTFKKFVQGSVYGTKSSRRYFKEFGDPRIMDAETGKYISEAESAGNFDNTRKPMPDERKAGELIHFALYCPWTPYGMPRWYGSLLSALGARNAEEINWVTLKNNNIPSLVLTVSNGRLTEATLIRIQEFIDSHIKGSNNYSQILLLEGESGSENDTTNQVKVDIKPLTEHQHTDQLFTTYIKACNDSVRRSFRFSGIFTGHTEGLNKALSDTARRLGDEQVFAPERDEFDFFINAVIFPELGIVYHEFKSRTPNITDNAELIAMMATAERSGAMTPERSDLLIKDIFPGVDKYPLDPNLYNLKMPWSATMAEMVKNQALTTEIGQQFAPTQPSAIEPQVSVEDVVKSEEGVLRVLDVADMMATEVRRALGQK